MQGYARRNGVLAAQEGREIITAIMTEEEKMKINLSRTKEAYYTQLNNEFDPYISCQTTSMVMGLDIAGFGLGPIKSIPNCIFSQPEDKLRWFMLNDRGIQDFWKANCPDLSIPAPEYLGCMVCAVNYLYGDEVAYADYSLTIPKIKCDLMAGMPVYTSMAYPGNLNFAGSPAPVGGHIVLVVGIDGESLIINDPYKNHLTGERDGFNNYYHQAAFCRHNKGYGIRYKRA